MFFQHISNRQPELHTRNFFSINLKLMGRMNHLLKYKCPRCYQGDLFPSEGFMKMNESCNHCNQKYVIEPGFYWGAMYVAYAISGGLCLILAVLLFLVIKKWSTNTNMFIIGSVALVSSPFVFKLARACWIYMFVKHDIQYSADE